MIAPFDPGLQSGGRRPAPGRLGLVQAFVNSHFSLEHDRGADLLATPEELAAWMRARALPAGDPERRDRERAVAAREALRALLAEHNGAARDPDAHAVLASAARGSVVGLRVESAGVTVPEPRGEGVDCLLGLVLAVVHEARAADTWKRLKVCPSSGCAWAFYDHSRNASSSWCSMAICGSREKARAYRRRSRDH